MSIIYRYRKKLSNFLNVKFYFQYKKYNYFFKSKFKIIEIKWKIQKNLLILPFNLYNIIY